MNKELLEHRLNINRRRFLSRLSIGLGSVALGSLLIPDLFSGSEEDEKDFLTGRSAFCSKSKTDHLSYFKTVRHRNWNLFDYKPMLTKMMGKDLPASVRMGQRLTGMTADQKKFPLSWFITINSINTDKSGAWVSELFPDTAKIVDDLCIIKSNAHRSNQS